MNETKYSSSSIPGESWEHEFYNQGATMFGAQVSSEATVISTTASGSTTNINIPSITATTTHHQYLNVPSDQGAGGRISKQVRRRSRASRRTPTTLLNTDTTNFRAMVQQFTGGGPFFSSTAGGSHSQYGSLPGEEANFSFGIETRNQILNPTVASSGAPFYQLQYQQQYHHQQQEQYYQGQQHQPYMYSFMNNSRPDMEEMSNQASVPGGFSMDHVPLPLPPRPPS